MPGEYLLNVPRAAYDALTERESWSLLKHMGRSPAHYLDARSKRDTGLVVDETYAAEAPKKVGRAFHLSVLEPDKFDLTCVTWEGGKRQGGAWEAFERRNAEREILTTKEAEFCRAASKAVRAHPLARKHLDGGQAEVTLLWECQDILMKSRLDYVTAGAGAIIDLKSTKDASLEGFPREVWNYRYDAQAALYVDAYEAVTGVELPYIIIAVEKTSPNVVTVFEVPQAVLDIGRYHYRGLLERLAACRAAKKWPGYVDGDAAAQLTLPPWALHALEENNLDGLGLVFGEDDAA